MKNISSLATELQGKLNHLSIRDLKIFETTIQVETS